jgi:hypothetical protein
LRRCSRGTSPIEMRAATWGRSLSQPRDSASEPLARRRRGGSGRGSRRWPRGRLVASHGLYQHEIVSSGDEEDEHPQIRQQPLQSRLEFDWPVGHSGLLQRHFEAGGCACARRRVRENGLDVRPRIDVVRRATNPVAECRGRAADDHHVEGLVDCPEEGLGLAGLSRFLSMPGDELARASSDTPSLSTTCSAVADGLGASVGMNQGRLSPRPMQVPAATQLPPRGDFA